MMFFLFEIVKFLRMNLWRQFPALAQSLGPLVELLENPEVSEICVNGPANVWYATHEGFRKWDDQLSERAARDIADSVANFTSQIVTPEKPLLSASIGEGIRVQAVLEPAAAENAVVIRKPVVRRMSLEDYESGGSFEYVNAGVADQARDGSMREFYESGEWLRFLKEAVVAKRNILVVGGTHSGKTTLMNTLLEEVPLRDRIVTVEDSRELALRQQNQVNLLSSRGDQGVSAVKASDLLIASLRLRPDRIIFGELRGAEAFAWLRAVASAHPGSISSVHAESGEDAYQQIGMMTSEGSNMPFDYVVDFARKVIDIVVVMTRLRIEGRDRYVISAIEWKGATGAKDD